MSRHCLICPLILLLTGCGAGSGGAAPSQADEARLSVVPQSTGRSAGRSPVGQKVFLVDVYQLSVPFGTISLNDSFWKVADEHAVDVATYDLLYRNGIRVGRAPNDEWEHFKEIIEAHPADVKKMTITAASARAVELPMKREVAYQDIFYFDSRNVLSGRSYNRCENLISLSFEPVPRRPDEVRIALCPVVRASQRRLVYTPQHQEREVQYVNPERLYDLNLVADIPPGHFLIVAPSSEGRWPTSLGSAFLIREGETERHEQVLLIIPRQVRVQEQTQR